MFLDYIFLLWQYGLVQWSAIMFAINMSCLLSRRWGDGSNGPRVVYIADGYLWIYGHRDIQIQIDIHIVQLATLELLFQVISMHSILWASRIHDKPRLSPSASYSASMLQQHVDFSHHMSHSPDLRDFVTPENTDEANQLTHYPPPSLSQFFLRQYSPIINDQFVCSFRFWNNLWSWSGFCKNIQVSTNMYVYVYLYIHDFLACYMFAFWCFKSARAHLQVWDSVIWDFLTYTKTNNRGIMFVMFSVYLQQLPLERRLWIVISLLRETLLTLLCGALSSQKSWRLPIASSQTFRKLILCNFSLLVGLNVFDTTTFWSDIEHSHGQWHDWYVSSHCFADLMIGVKMYLWTHVCVSVLMYFGLVSLYLRLL